MFILEKTRERKVRKLRGMTIERKNGAVKCKRNGNDNAGDADIDEVRRKS